MCSSDLAALAFQYVSESPPDLSLRVPPYTDNLNSWLGQILQRDAGHIPVEIVDVETTGYVLRLCPFEDVAMVGLTAEDVEAFLQCVEEKCGILNATVTQRTKFMELIDLEPSVQHVDIAHWAGLGGVRYIPADYIDSQTEKMLELAEERLRQRMAGTLKPVRESSPFDREVKKEFRLPSFMDDFAEVPTKEYFLKNAAIFAVIGLVPCVVRSFAGNAITVALGVAIYKLYNRGAPESSGMEAEMRPPKAKPLILTFGICFLAAATWSCSCARSSSAAVSRAVSHAASSTP